MIAADPLEMQENASDHQRFEIEKAALVVAAFQQFHGQPPSQRLNTVFDIEQRLWRMVFAVLSEPDVDAFCDSGITVAQGEPGEALVYLSAGAFYENDEAYA